MLKMILPLFMRSESKFMIFKIYDYILVIKSKLLSLGKISLLMIPYKLLLVFLVRIKQYLSLTTLVKVKNFRKAGTFLGSVLNFLIKDIHYIWVWTFFWNDYKLIFLKNFENFVQINNWIRLIIMIRSRSEAEFIF